MVRQGPGQSRQHEAKMHRAASAAERTAQERFSMTDTTGKGRPGKAAQRRQGGAARQPGRANGRETHRGNKEPGRTRSPEGVKDARTKVADSLTAAFDRLRETAEAHDSDLPGGMQ